MENETIKPGKYRHFKGKEYEVLFLARHSETEETMVVYRKLYDDYSLWVRPASMWNETVERDGQVMRRFTYIGESTPLSTFKASPLGAADFGHRKGAV